MGVDEPPSREVSSRAIVGTVAGFLAGMAVLILCLVTAGLANRRGDAWVTLPPDQAGSALLLLGGVVFPGVSIGAVAGWIAFERPLAPTLIASVAYTSTFPMAFPWNDIPLNLGVWQYQPPAWVNVGASTTNEQLFLSLILLVGTILPAAIASRIIYYVHPWLSSR